MLKLPMKGRPADVLSDLAQFVSGTIGQKSVAKFCIGRTGDLDSALSRNKCDNILALYRADRILNAIKVESSLIELLRDNDKCANSKERRPGGGSRSSASYVYLAIWYNMSVVSR